MRRAIPTTQFKKDVKLMRRRHKELEKLRLVMDQILAEEDLAPALRDHVLVGTYMGRRECHVEPDWLLIYRFEGNDFVVFERTGSHSDLFQ